MIWPLKFADLFEQAGTRPPKGILLAGKPGCGKTLLASRLPGLLPDASDAEAMESAAIASVSASSSPDTR